MPTEVQSSLIEQYYSIVFKIVDENLYETEDILELYVTRMPIQHIATYFNLVCSIPRIIYSLIEDRIRNSILLNCTLEIHAVDINRPDSLDPRKKQKVKLLIKKYFVMSNCVKLQEYNENIYGSSDLPIVRFELKTPLVFYLSTHKRFNNQYFNITSYNAILQLENVIKNEFKDGINFDFKYVPSNYINKHIYEHILITGKNDLLLPFYLIQNYKPTQVPTYYFFDDFYYDERLKKDQTCAFMVSQVNQDQFQKINITDKKYVDFAQSFDPTPQIQHIIDKTRFFNNPASQYNILLKNKNQFISLAQELKSKVPFTQMQGTSKDDPQDYDRFDVKQFETVFSQMRNGANNALELYVPDNKEDALARFNIVSNLFREQYQALYTFKNNIGFFDVVQFNRVYNLDITDLKNFNFLPISIVNKFYKLNANESVYIHSCNFQMLKFKSNE